MASASAPVDADTVADDLATREAGPAPHRRPGFQAPRTPAEMATYHADWNLWRAIWRDARLTNAEAAVKLHVLAGAIAEYREKFGT